MPRAAAPNSCRTCRSRKVKCDGQLPTCLRCQKQDLHCDRSSDLTFKQYNLPQFEQAEAEKTPSEQLKDITVAHLFHIYIKELAPWYDLNEPSCSSFGTIVPVAALDSPLLFAAIIAFAGTYAHRKYRFPIAIPQLYHNRCLHMLISLKPNDKTIGNGIALAATCLLRSYEILSEREDPNRHLFGASVLLPIAPGIHDRGLLPSGFWNYLREDITYSLIHECPLKIQIRFCDLDPERDEEHANHITLLLAALINAHFGKLTANMLPAFESWRNKFSPVPFSRLENSPFPIVRMLQDCHVAALHYYHVALCILVPNVRSSSAVEICSLAMYSESDPLVVNAYGPICFSGRWLDNIAQQKELINWLRKSQIKTAWSVEILINKLQQRWAQTHTSHQIKQNKLLVED